MAVDALRSGSELACEEDGGGVGKGCRWAVILPSPRWAREAAEFDQGGTSPLSGEKRAAATPSAAVVAFLCSVLQRCKVAV
nr:hypothetical protein Itr_chr05CG14280 [Ipomoea trifida]